VETTQKDRGMSVKKIETKSSNGWKKLGLNEVSQYDAAKIIVDAVRQYMEAGHSGKLASDGKSIAILLPGVALDDSGKLVIPDFPLVESGQID